MEPKVKVTILPSVYDPERYRRGIATLNHAFSRALASQLTSGKGKTFEPGEDSGL